MDSLPADHLAKSVQFTPRLHYDVYQAIEPGNPELSLAGKVVMVTGASRGIGSRGIVPSLAKAGASGIILAATNAEKLKAVESSVQEINSSSQTLIVASDVSKEESVVNLFNVAVEVFGHVDVLVHNAGVMGELSNIHEADPEAWWRSFEVNTFGTFLVCKHFLKIQPASKGPGAIVFITSAAGWQSNPLMSGYSGSKLAAQKLLSDIAAGYPNVNTFSVEPGLVETDMLSPAFKKFNLSSPGLVGGTVVWLISDQAKFLSGRAISANWDVEDLADKREEIMKEDLLTIAMRGKFGAQHFQ
ncbi:short chain dehydrogenase reductase [Colletotrichum tofieldiae]|nr:short chain dehydrogenase reductase [Colletotrichum tofieldiae]GKT71573.1 short chain dehydrogenase reductase [Colletotrichum tofieldiae]